MNKITYQCIILKVFAAAISLHLCARDYDQEGLTNRLNRIMEDRANRSMRIEARFEQKFEECIINFPNNAARWIQEKLSEIIEGPPPPPTLLERLYARLRQN